ncbi:conserved hypothetical protein [Ricinus communis]|uniref:Uncharacterized protein n=1 Tax=Ricinus communis TaxID=3988 RepID=B9TBL8_RICCO|nr:conserved hypothetical protein [Ricinus communis]
MNCFARWRVDERLGLEFRDQTILQFGDSWDPLATFILLNPGSATPSSDIDQSGLLISQGISSVASLGGRYLPFSIDPLMRGIFKLFSTRYSGGVIRLQNLFNLRNQHSANARAQLNQHSDHPYIFASDAEIDFGSAPVIVACGEISADQLLVRELSRLITLSSQNSLYQVAKEADRLYSVVAVPSPGHVQQIDCYHPSYTFKYGNTTNLGALSI